MVYLIDYFTKFGRLFRSDRIVARNDAMAKLEAIALAGAVMPDSYKVMRLERVGYVVIRNRKQPAPLEPSLMRYHYPNGSSLNSWTMPG